MFLYTLSFEKKYEFTTSNKEGTIYAFLQTD